MAVTVRVTDWYEWVSSTVLTTAGKERAQGASNERDPRVMFEGEEKRLMP